MNTFRKYKLNLLTPVLYSHAFYTRFTQRVDLMRDTSRPCGVTRHSYRISRSFMQATNMCGVILLHGVEYEGWNFNSGNLYKIDTCFEVLLSFSVVTSIVYNPLPAMWKS